ncbi:MULTISPECIES: DUF742 domain-containing protein [unclassified Streptomyces]|uniref:DUF742 domain-containing protein n=1 Tax=unclassified Streptomyces TaxID=2593676 RepID=UPI002E2F3A11|nr:DUF742 domain-containing protein [Streptomyces sp. NBC_01460]WSS26633.1 DUF742 domain-containing protein [Streptomyces sp. NBC_01185]
MAAPTGGHPYEGGQRVPGEQGDNRFDTPSVPGRQGPQETYQPYQPYQQSHQGSQGGDWQQQPQQPGSGWPQQQPHYQQPQQGQQPPQRYDAPPSRIQPVQRQAPAPAKPAAHNPLVRPYAMTGGRTRPRYQLAIEALVSTTADPSRLQGQLPEHQRICRLCIEIKSVAEVSALLSIPLGVARILVADLAEAGLVAIHQPGGDEAAGGQPDVTLLERVLSGLRKL